MEIKGYFGKEELDRIIQHVNRCDIEKKICFYEDDYYDEEDGFSAYPCLFPGTTFEEVEPYSIIEMLETEYFSKSEMLYLQKHGFVFENEDEEIVDVKTLKE